MTDQTNLIQYLTELRKRLLNCLFLFIIFFFILFYFSNSLYSGIALPLLKHLPHGQGLIATNVISPFFVPIELTFVASLFLGMPFFLYQLWKFVAPALYHHEKKRVWPLLFLSIILFYVGVAFAYFIIFPLLFSFITHTAPKGVLVSPDIGLYLDFVLKMFLIFGGIFEVPVITIICVWTGIISREKLIQFRPYAIVGAFVIGMLLGPPDVISQTLLAIPLWLLFEIGIFFSKFFR